MLIVSELTKYTGHNYVTHYHIVLYCIFCLFLFILFTVPFKSLGQLDIFFLNIRFYNKLIRIWNNGFNIVTKIMVQSRQNLAMFPSFYFNAHFEASHVKRVMETTNLE